MNSVIEFVECEIFLELFTSICKGIIGHEENSGVENDFSSSDNNDLYK